MSGIFRTPAIRSDYMNDLTGYGIVPKQVMKDARLTIEAKAIYCYLVAYAGNDGYAFPSLDLILNELQISEKRYYKHRDILIKLGYISTVEEKNKKGQYSRVIFKINPLMQNEEVVKKPFPQNEETVKPFMQNDGMEEIKENQGLSTKPFMQNDGMEGKPFPHFSIWENDGHTNNNITINNNNILLSSYEDSIENDKTFTQTPYEEIKNLFNNTCTTLPKVRAITKNRQKTIKQRWKENPNIDFFKELFEKVNNSDFLSGRSGKWQGCCFDWILKPSNLQKIIEGNYDNKTSNDNDWGDFNVES